MWWLCCCNLHGADPMHPQAHPELLFLLLFRAVCSTQRIWVLLAVHVLGLKRGL
jgi:hypothetical protein